MKLDASKPDADRSGIGATGTVVPGTVVPGTVDGVGVSGIGATGTVVPGIVDGVGGSITVSGSSSESGESRAIDPMTRNTMAAAATAMAIPLQYVRRPELGVGISVSGAAATANISRCSP